MPARTITPAILLVALAACGSRSSTPPAPQPSAAVRAAMVDLFAADFRTMADARQVLVAHRDEALPLLVAEVDREDRVELTDTADLIYPGADAFYGHGVVVQYDLDHLGDRAGWVLEEIAGEQFGFATPSWQPGAGEDAAAAAARRRDARAAVAAWWSQR